MSNCITCPSHYSRIMKPRKRSAAVSNISRLELGFIKSFFTQTRLGFFLNFDQFRFLFLNSAFPSAISSITTAHMFNEQSRYLFLKPIFSALSRRAGNNVTHLYVLFFFILFGNVSNNARIFFQFRSNA